MVYNCCNLNIRFEVFAAWGKSRDWSTRKCPELALQTFELPFLYSLVNAYQKKFGAYCPIILNRKTAEAKSTCLLLMWSFNSTSPSYIHLHKNKMPFILVVSKDNSTRLKFDFPFPTSSCLFLLFDILAPVAPFLSNCLELALVGILFKETFVYMFIFIWMPMKVYSKSASDLLEVHFLRL